MKKISVSLFLLIAFSTHALSIITFRNTNIYGLSERYIHQVSQDSAGYLWLSTSTGIYRFDGREMKALEHLALQKNENKEVPVKNFLISKDHLFYLQGNSLFTLSFSNYNLHQTLLQIERPNDVNFALFPTQEILALWSDSMLILMDIASNKLSSYNIGHSYKTKITKISPIGSSHAIIVLKNGIVLGISIEKKHNGSCAYHQLFAKQTPFNEISKAYFDGSRLWIEASRKIFQTKIDLNFKGISPFKLMYESKKTVTFLGKFGNQIACANVDELWGIDPVKNTTNKINYEFIDQESSQIVQKYIQQCFQSHDGIIWIKSNEGLYVYDPLQLTFNQLKVTDAIYKNNPARFIYADQYGEIWLSISESGVFRYNPLSRKIENYQTDKFHKLVNNTAFSILVDRNKILWLGGIELSKYNYDFKQIEYYQPNENKINTLCEWVVWHLLETRNGELWVSTHNGVNKYNPNTNDFTQYKCIAGNKNSIINNHTWYMEEDCDGWIWIGSNRGLTYYEPKYKRFTRFSELIPESKRLNEFAIKCIFQDSIAKDIWIATEGDGLYRYSKKNRKLVNLNQEQGLPSNVLWKIVEDQQHNLWVTTSNGLSCIDPKTFSVIRNYYKNDGLPAHQFWSQSITQTDNGKIYLGTQNYICWFSPAERTQNSIAPKIVLKQIVLNEKPAKYQQIEKLVLRSSDFPVTFEFATLHFTSPIENKLWVKLEGPDSTDWIHISKSQTLQFDNLAAGHYRLKAKAGNADNIWTSELVIKTFKVKPTYWKYTIGGFVILFLASIIWIASKNKKDVVKNLVAEYPKVKYEKSMISEDQLDEYARLLTNFMETSKAYCNQNLSLQDVAEKLEVNRHVLSQVLNLKLQKNFYDFVNQYRVEECKRRIKANQHQHLTIQALGESCGFSSKSAFYNVFKKFTGMTPSEFKSQH